MCTRRGVVLATGLYLACLTCSQAFAIKIVYKVSRQNAESAGFVINALPVKEDGTVMFIITRDLSKAKSFDSDSELTIRREATLRVHSDAGLLIECRVEPEIEKNILKYRFTLAQGLLPRAHLTVSEDDDYKNLEGRPHLIGGGTIYEIALDQFKAK